jgi:TPR repeat protein
LEKATHCFRLASKEGCPVGMFLYGISLRHGWGCRPNCALAFQYLQTAAEHAVHNLLQQDAMLLASKAELIMAIYELGVSFQQGWGVMRNKEVAFYYFEMAANLGDLDAMNDLAFCYLHGRGVRKDVFRAAKYYRMAAKQGQGLVGNSWIWKKKYDIVESL